MWWTQQHIKGSVVVLENCFDNCYNQEYAQHSKVTIVACYMSQQ